MLVYSRQSESPVNTMVNWIAALIAYTYQPKKPSINFEETHKRMLAVA